jgi:hypothetical protein
MLAGEGICQAFQPDALKTPAHDKRRRSHQKIRRLRGCVSSYSETTFQMFVTRTNALGWGFEPGELMSCICQDDVTAAKTRLRIWQGWQPRVRRRQLRTFRSWQVIESTTSFVNENPRGGNSHACSDDIKIVVPIDARSPNHCEPGC